jgi:alkylated DNA repair dioxygenase AlkB
MVGAFRGPGHDGLPIRHGVVLLVELVTNWSVCGQDRLCSGKPGVLGAGVSVFAPRTQVWHGLGWLAGAAPQAQAASLTRIEKSRAASHIGSMTQRSLFPAVSQAFADGYAYEPDFLSRAEEEALLGEIERLPLAQAEYKGFLANRRIVSYGGKYDFSAQQLQPGEPIPPFLHPLRARAAAWVGCPAGDFTHALIAEYPPGSQLGWHRDVPEFEQVVGFSLAGACRMRFRRYPPRFREKSIALDIEPRSIYRLQGPARWEWQHCVPPVPGLRYSITLRTLRK